MIKADDGKIQLKGTKVDFLTDLTMIMKALRENGIDDDMINTCVKLSSLKEDELLKEMQELLVQKFLEFLQDKKDKKGE